MKRIRFADIKIIAMIFFVFSMNVLKVTASDYEPKLHRSFIKEYFEPDTSMLAIWSSINVKELKELIANNDSYATIEYLKQLAIRIDAYILWRYNVDVREDYSTTLPLATVATGLILFAKEQGYVVKDGIFVDPLGRIDPYDCFMDVLGDLVGIGVLTQLYNDFASGNVGIMTIKKSLKAILRRVAFGITIALTILDLIFCLT